MKRTKTLRFVFVVSLGIFISCKDKTLNQQAISSEKPSPIVTTNDNGVKPPKKNDVIKIAMNIQEYKNNNIIEIPYFDYGEEKIEIIESINRLYNMGLAQMYFNFQKNASEGEWLEIRTYPFISEKYLQVITTSCIFPSYATSGDLESVNYDKEQNKWITITDAMQCYEMDDNDISEAVSNLFVPEFEGQKIDKVDTVGFLIKTSEGKVEESTQFLLEITTINNNGDSLKSFYGYTPNFDELYLLNSLCLFDPSEMDEMNPPLSYQNTNKNNSEKDDKYYESQLGGEIIAPGVVYVSSLLEGDMGENISPFNASKALYYHVLTSIYNDDDYSQDEPIFIEIVDVGPVLDEEDECYIINVNGSLGEFLFAVSYKGNVYQFGDGMGVRYWGNINDK